MQQDGSVGNFLTEEEAEAADAFGRQNFMGQMSAASAGMWYMHPCVWLAYHTAAVLLQVSVTASDHHVGCDLLVMRSKMALCGIAPPAVAPALQEGQQPHA